MSKKLTNQPIFGFYNLNELVRYYNLCDLYVHPSGIDIESVSIIEAICCGCTLLVSDSKKSSSRYFALDDRNIFKHNNAKDLAKKIDYWLEHKEEREICSKHYASLIDKFTYNVCMSSMEDMMLKTFIDKVKKNKNKAV